MIIPGIMAAKVRTATPVGYRFLRLSVSRWRANFSLAVSGSHIRVGELIYFTADNTAYPTSGMTSDTTPSPYVVTTSSNNNLGANPRWWTFNKNNSQQWIAGNLGPYPHWVTIDMGIDVLPTYVDYSPGNGPSFGFWPVDFNFLASATGSFSGEEVVLASFTNIDSGWVDNTLRRLNF